MNAPASDYTLLPVVRHVRADLDTPLSAYLKLVDGPDACLLESVEGSETWGRYSIIALPARERVEVRGRHWRRLVDGVCAESRVVVDPLAEVQALVHSERVAGAEGLPAFAGGWVGYFAFETLGYIEPKLDRPERTDQLGTPEIVLLRTEELAVFDNRRGRLSLIVHARVGEEGAQARAERRLDQLTRRLRAPAPGYPEVLDPQALDEAHFVSGFTRAEFEDAVRRCQDYILAGDAFQIVLSQRLSVPFRARPIDVYRALRSLNPSPYMYFMDLGELHVVGSSPEILVRLKDGEVVVRPIAGTLPRGASAAEDEANAQRLLADPKECAEHLMLIDLGRNDVGRVARAGSVRLSDQMVIERYSHVMHIVSQVVGRLQPGLDIVDVLRATFPAGTLSGAPKIRAVEIIQDLEPVKRNLYGGAVGYINWQGEADLAIAIRTALIKDGRLHVQAGAGIVADSDPGKEWEETMNKGRAVFRAVAEAVRGL
ncbi:MAG: anthranilate synthase component 1 [Lysobacterales bacterium]